MTIPGTFVEVELPGKAMVFKEGFVARKNVMEGSHKKGWYTVFSWGVEPGNEAIRLHEGNRIKWGPGNEATCGYSSIET